MKVLALLLLLTSSAPSWNVEKKVDAFRGTHYTRYILTGSFLQAPSDGQLEAPALVVDCQPGHHSVGYHVYKNGQFYDAFIIVGAMVSGAPEGIPVQYRLDGGKIQSGVWNRSTNFKSLFLSEGTLNNLFFGHFARHSANTSSPINSFAVAVDEYVAGEVDMRFDLPDDPTVAEACGLIVHKK